MPIKIYLTILKQAAKIGVMQVALGGGNPNQHPLFSDILRATWEDHGVVPSFTTNGRGLTSQIVEASRKYCGAVAVTAHEPYDEMQLAVRRLVASGVKTNIHFVLNKSSVDTAISWLKNPPKALDGINAIVFLNYKPVGRISDVEVVLHHSHRVREFFQLACSSIAPFRVGFDSCLVSGLVTHVNVNSVWFDACEAARFSMFISERAIAFPCSFTEPNFKGIPVKENNLQQIWQESSLFRWFRNAILEPHCQSCSKTNICMGGCPLFSEINLC